MAKTTGVDKFKIGALLLFIAVSVFLVSWTVWDAFGESNRNTSTSEEYQVSVVDTPVSTNTEWSQQDRVTPEHSATHEHRRTPSPNPTDQFDTD